MRGIWTEQIKKRFRNAGILEVALCVVIGIAVMKQDKEEVPEEALIADMEVEEQGGEELSGESYRRAGFQG